MSHLIAETVIKHFISMKNRIINLIIAAPVLVTLFVAILYKIDPVLPVFAAVIYSVVLLIAVYQVGKFYDQLKTSK